MAGGAVLHLGDQRQHLIERAETLLEFPVACVSVGQHCAGAKPHSDICRARTDLFQIPDSCFRPALQQESMRAHQTNLHALIGRRRLLERLKLLEYLEELFRLGRPYSVRLIEQGIK
ncbi:hypothetical protein ASD77_13660 [Pseudoxanthomonas sp. Root65]|nr:hypothetical protein ASD77_13660 [Pseudoxanthomonas sp. Root65]